MRISTAASSGKVATPYLCLLFAAAGRDHAFSATKEIHTVLHLLPDTGLYRPNPKSNLYSVAIRAGAILLLFLLA